MRYVVTAVCLWFSSVALSQDAGSRAKHLVTIAQLSELSAMGLHKSIEPMQRQGMTDKQAACIRSVDGSRYVPVLARVALSELTPSEIDEAIRFYESPAGKKYIEMTVVTTTRQMGIRTDRTMPDFTAEEVEATEAFGKTLVFQKLVNENILTRSPTGMNEMRALTMQILKDCGAGRQG